MDVCKFIVSLRHGVHKTVEQKVSSKDLVVVEESMDFIVRMFSMKTGRDLGKVILAAVTCPSH